MKTFNKNLLWVSIAALALTGCGSSSDSSNDNAGDDHDHEHESSVLVSQTGTTALSLLEDGELEVLDDAAAGNEAKLVLSESGAYAAVLANGTVNFVHGLHEEEEEEHEEEGHDEEEHEHEEAHVLDFSLDGSQVITTNGHFAVLNAGSTIFVEYDELETITEAPTAISVGTETYPALMIDEDHELVMAFVGGNAAFYEDGLAIDGTSYACENPMSHGQSDELVVVDCDEGALAVVIEENESEEHTFTYSRLTLDGTAADYTWQAQGHVIVGFEPSTSNYAIVELDESGATPSIVVVKSSDTGTYAFTQNICNLVLDTEAQDILAISAAGSFVVLNHEAEMLKSITLDESAASSCGDFVMAGAAKMALVIDNKAQKGYEIDVDEPSTNANGYHVHERFDLSVSDVASMVIFHEVGEEAGDHAH